MFAVELLHTFGLSLILFRILPSVDMIRGLMVLTSVAVFPAFMKTLIKMREFSTGGGPKRFFLIILNAFAFLIQLGAIPVMMLLGFTMSHSEKTTALITAERFGNNTNTLERDPTTTGLSFHSIMWEIPVGLICVSLAYWENFADSDLYLCGLRISMNKWKKNLHACREKVYMFVSLWKIVWTLIFAYLLLDNFYLTLFVHSERNVTTTSGEVKSVHKRQAPISLNTTTTTTAAPGDDKAYLVEESIRLHFLGYGPMWALMFATVVCTYFGMMACKLCMQIVGFAMPMMLATPATLAVILTQCMVQQWIPGHLNLIVWFCPEEAVMGDMLPFHYIAFGLLWLSQMIIASHIWFPASGRMTKTER